jgi:GntR family transcriptional regulator, transcriptional repressor for pyruvate dehydrogenase complex
MSQKTHDIFSQINLSSVSLRLQIADKIQDLIKDQHLEVGTKLPQERVLAEKFNVNRATLREGIRMLEQRGLIVMKRGVGTFIARVPIDTVTESLQRYTTMGLSESEELLILREILEPEIAALAAQNANENDIMELGKSIKVIEEVTKEKDIDRYVKGDEDFHELLAIASHIELLVGIIKGLRNNMIDHRRYIIRELHEENAKANLEVFEAVRKHAPNAARKAMKAHMLIAREAFDSVRIK